MTRSFGPAGYRADDGAIVLGCVTAATHCFLLGTDNICREHERKVENCRKTPDWCKYAPGIRKDIEVMEDFERMGLARLQRSDLMKLMKDVPIKHRAQWLGKPFPLREHNAEMMRYAIRNHRLAIEGGQE